MSSEPLHILVREVTGPDFVLWKWTEDDYKKPIRLKIQDADVAFWFVAEPRLVKSEKLPDMGVHACSLEQDGFELEVPIL